MRDPLEQSGYTRPVPDHDVPPVLIVDDEAHIRNLLAVIVNRAGGRGEPAPSAAAARGLLEQRSFACAIIDKNLPDGSGMDLLAHLHASAPGTPVIVVTGYANVESAVEALRLGAFDYILKPFDIAAVEHRVRMALDRVRLRRDLESTVIQLRHAHASLAESRQEVKRAYLETVLRLSRAAEYRDPAAGDHVERISRYAAILARAVEATEEWIEGIVLAAPLHDVGMVGVPEAVLYKPGPLTDVERRQIEEHVPIGARILEGTTADVLALGREIVLHHHERWDGKGYPAGLAGDRIPLSGRIVAVADAWDALTTDRPYRRALTTEAAVAELSRGAGTLHDPTLIEAFLGKLEQIKAARSGA
jgi:putative two-component system response regulator